MEQASYDRRLPWRINRNSLLVEASVSRDSDGTAFLITLVTLLMLLVRCFDAATEGFASSSGMISDMDDASVDS